MQRSFWGRAAVLAVLLGQLGCEGPTRPHKRERIRTLPPSARPAITAGLSTEQLNLAARLWVAKCARCHPLYDPGAYHDVKWTYWMTRMSKKAHLKPEQEELVSRYLGAFRAVQ